MKAYVLIYEQFANFEIVIPMLILKTKYEVITIGVTKDKVHSSEGMQCEPHMTIEDVILTKKDVLVIPGGDPTKLFDHEGVYDLIRQANELGITIGAICAAPIHLAKAGILSDREYTTSLDPKEDNPFNPDMYVHDNVIVDEHIITAKPSGYVDFGIVLGQQLDLYEDQDDFEETVDFFREFQF